MLSANHLFIVLLLFFLMLLIFWGGRRLLTRLRRRSQNFKSDVPASSAVEDKKRLDLDESKLLRTYFRGLSYILSNETDKAVAEFVKVAQVDTTTAEIYLALGQLFRNSGEVERAIRVHRDILLRPNLPDDVRLQTFFEIGLDYKKAGFLDRACRTFEEILEQNPNDQVARDQLSSTYVSMREWEKALSLHKNFPASKNEPHIIAHLTAEVAKNYDHSGDKVKASVLFKKAIDLDKECIDVWFHYGDFLINEGHLPEALEAWEKAFLINPEFITQVIERFTELPELKRAEALDDFFHRHLEKYGKLRKFNLAYIDWQISSGRVKEAELRLTEVLEETGGDSETFFLAKRLLQIALPVENSEQNHYSSLVHTVFAAKFRFEKRYYCQKCGFRIDRMNCKCPRCSSWDSIAVR